MRIISIGLVGLSFGGCAFEENLRQGDLTGKVRIPLEALESFQLIDPDGTPIVDGGFTLDEDGQPVLDITDQMGLLGPVYVGAFPSVEDGHFDYPHPEMGPILDADKPGDTYPYGGTTVGRFDYACYEQLRCKVVTGRHSDYGDIIDFFSDVVQEPIVAPDGTEVTSGSTYQEHCFTTEYVTSNDELSFIDDDPQEDVLPYFKPYFKLNSEGTHYVADVTIPHTLVVDEMELWGWVDMPSARYNFSTCDESNGAYHYRYTEQYYKGSSYPDLLNYPGLYVDEGDWVVEDPYVVDSADNEFVIDFTFKFEG
jgi:hypothetical protein